MSTCIKCGAYVPEGSGMLCSSCKHKTYYEAASSNDCENCTRCHLICKEDDVCYKSASDKTLVDTTVFLMLSKFGEDSQIDVCIEEMSELIKELVKYKRSKIHSREKHAASREHVIEEIGDVMFMMEYLKQVFDISNTEIQNIILQKSERTRKRYLDAKDS